MKRRWAAPRWLRSLGLAVVLLWTAYGVWMVADRGAAALDDFYITFRYAQNFAQGDGLVFNPGERVFGTTAPGYALGLGLLGKMTGVAIPRLGNALTGLALLAVATLLLLESRRRWPEAVVGGTLLMTSGFVWLHGGAELPVSLALLVAAARWGRERPILAGVLATAAVACRPDAGLAVGILGLLLWREEGRLPQRFGWTAAAGIALGLGAAYLWFGQPLPATLAAKRFQSEWAPNIFSSGWDFWIRGLSTLRPWGFGGGLTIPAAALLGCIPMVRRGGRGMRLLGLYGAALAVAYPLLAVPFYSWYAEGTVIALLYGVSFFIGAMARRVWRFFQPGPLDGVAGARWVTAGVAVLLAWWLLLPVARFHLAYLGAPKEGGRFGFYRQVGEWIRDHSEPGEAVSYVEVGVIAFYGQRPIRDLVGLVTPENLEGLRRHGSPERLLREHPTPLVIYAERVDRLMGPVRDAPWFGQCYRPVERFRLDQVGEELVVYRRQSCAVPFLPPSTRLE
jgi:hypothetical protein